MANLHCSEEFNNFDVCNSSNEKYQLDHLQTQLNKLKIRDGFVVLGDTCMKEDINRLTTEIDVVKRSCYKHDVEIENFKAKWALEIAGIRKRISANEVLMDYLDTKISVAREELREVSIRVDMLEKKKKKREKKKMGQEEN